MNLMNYPELIEIDFLSSFLKPVAFTSSRYQFVEYLLPCLGLVFSGH